MPIFEKDKIVELQKCSANIRNVCILAHVDHGKTTLADSLIASNKIISQKLAGKLRYMDSRKDEQLRGITMKSSSISLYFESKLLDAEFLFNLIDSPGHVDFSSEVSTAVRLCDCAIIVVDVIEGPCAQTRVCLQQAYTEKLLPILVLNKIDRLILEKKMTPLDCYFHLQQLLEQTNAIMGNIFASDVMANETKSSDNDYISGLEESDDSNLYFCPLKCNVVFASAYDGWAFTLREFSTMYAERLGLTSDELMKSLWGDFYYLAKKKAVLPGAQEKGKTPMFVQFILDNIWMVYETIVVRKDREKIVGMAEKLNVKLTARDLRHTDNRIQLQALMSQWLPISSSILETLCKLSVGVDLMPEVKAKRLMCSLNQNFDSYPDATKRLVKEFQKNSHESEDVIVYVSKMFAVDRDQIPENRVVSSHKDLSELRRMARNVQKEIDGQSAETVGVDAVSEVQPEEEQDNEVFIAFARVYSGCLKRGMKLYALGPKHNPCTANSNDPLSSPYVSEVEIENLYVLMGRDLESVDEMPSGNIVGISGLQNHILKTGTLSTNIHCPPFTELTLTAKPILRVAVEPKNPLEMSKLLKGLKLLNQADACVQVAIQETGEHVIVTLGEVHLERCISDLEETFAKIKLNVSEPIVSFRETIVPKATLDMVNEAVINTAAEKAEIKEATIVTQNKQSQLKILAVPLPNEITEWLDDNSDILKALSDLPTTKSVPDHVARAADQLKKNITQYFIDNPSDVLPADLVDKIWSFGPKKCGPNLLLNLTADYRHQNVWSTNYAEYISSIDKSDRRSEYDSSFVNGFQMATIAGPLCEEPLRGLCFIVNEWTMSGEDDQTGQYGPFSGQIMSIVKDGCRRAFQNQPQRLVTPMYSCDIIVRSEALGGMYAFISRRHGRILSAELIQGSGSFSVTAVIPVIESSQFSQEFRSYTSGLAYPQLVFGHWEVVDIDPFWVPSTEEEILHFGEKADTVNRAKFYMDQVRKRKGLAVTEKLVEHAEKQRTLGKNK